MKRLVLIAGLLAAAFASASGDYGPTYSRYKAYTAPDIDIARFQEGQLGVLQPGMQRVYLYTAWRAISLGAKAKGAAGREGGLARADGSAFGHGWDDSGSVETGSKDEWLRETRLKESNFDSCPDAARSFALQTLKGISKRKDVTPARLKAWVDAQELVFTACKTQTEARYGDDSELGKILVPSVLSDKEPLYWRQLRDYQRAAALFFAEQYPASTKLFGAIGLVAEHPMRDLGKYLALRSEVRRAAKTSDKADEAGRQESYALLQARGQAILADASLADRHEATRATLRSIRAFLIPATVFVELTSYLADPAADPYLDDRLGDWVVVTRDDSPNAQGVAAHLKAAREKYDFVSWIEMLQDCAYRRAENELSCAAPAQRAMAQWQRTKSRPWLTASLMLASSLTPAQEAAALAVKPADPEYLTVRYHLARLYRLAGRSGETRAVADAALKLAMPGGSRNLFREERFAVATSIADAAAYMLRVDVDMSRGAAKPVDGFNDDGMKWMNNGLGVADMVALARSSALEPAVRARLASAAFMRAELLGKNDVAAQALDVLGPLVPAMKADIAAYRAAATPANRRHAMLLTALRFGLTPQLSENLMPITLVVKDEVTASNWCSFKPDRSADKLPFPWQLPPVPALGDQGSVKAELDVLAPLKTATGFVGDHVLARVKENSADSDLPWLLHVVVASTRGGCLDPDAKKLSREAFNVLHKRFPGNEWTKKTPYFY